MSSLIKKKFLKGAVTEYKWVFQLINCYDDQDTNYKPISDARTIVNDKSLGKHNDFIPLKSRRTQVLPVVLPESLKLRNAQLVW